MAIRDKTPHPIEVVAVAAAPRAPLDIPHAEQWGDEWCWAACAAMVLKFFHLPKKQCELVKQLLKKDNCCDGDPPAGHPPEPPPPAECDKSCKDGDVAKLYDENIVTATLHKRFVEFFELTDEIDGQRPVEIAINRGGRSRHLIIVKWAGVDAGEEMVLINDPLDLKELSLAYTDLHAMAAGYSWTGIDDAAP